jgi:lipopolysaccharide transport system ATP-binding protein
LTVEEAIRLEKVSKRFRKRILRQDHTTIKTAFIEFFRPSLRRARMKYVRVFEDLDLSVEKGTTLGIIGRNGSGKSTLLKLLAGIYRPDSGRIQMSGRVSALLELGAGFHPEFTGRENVFINGIILGLTKKEIRDRFDEIVRFAEIEEFIDCPVRTYSTGMYMRLAFSVATHVDPDILLIDEVLAVGDEHFMHKCRKRLGGFKERKITILLVTHDLRTVESFCDEALWLESSLEIVRGDPREIVGKYRAHSASP